MTSLHRSGSCSFWSQGIKNKLIVPLTPDASTRNYFRIPWKKGKAVAAVYPEPFDPDFHPYLDVTRLFLENGIPVPEIYAVDGQSGVIVQEDLGDRQLFRVYEEAPKDECDEYKERAVNLIAQIQKATERPSRSNPLRAGSLLMSQNFPGNWIFSLSTISPA